MDFIISKLTFLKDFSTKKVSVPMWLLLFLISSLSSIAFLEYQRIKDEQQRKGELTIINQVLKQKDLEISNIQTQKKILYDSLQKNTIQLNQLQKNIDATFRNIDNMPINEQIELLRSKRPEAFTNTQ
ncbi:hypothetical protein VB776_16410 [Arcicella sp. DC2W]|uniref:Uncharacterized protein n=1 Tax=Arcicella gelida TaxID=2984195 RepID=A0ABU5S7R3_9BACT|nr:hypothetical protein [Arcicella sp. DC2W]MEA5404517.1 hypothetical protein [Arcicella sp. DC2W]